MKIKKGDTVKIITGADRGKNGKVLRTLPKSDKIVVEGINIKKRHRRARKEGQKGQVVDMAHPIHVSNVDKI